MNEDLLQTAIDLINEYNESEYGSDPYTLNDDISDLGILYTDDGEDGDHSVEVSVDLTKFTINYYYDGQLTKCEQYDSLEDLIDTSLSELDWDWIYSDSLDYAEEAGVRADY